MILAEKIVKLRKQVGWSQEELAEKLNVSRQSVSKWESTNSIPDLNKIIILAEIFDVSTDYLLKDDIETSSSISGGLENNTVEISQEQALQYVEIKRNIALLISKGVFLCVSSVIPLFALLAMRETNNLNLSSGVASVTGVISLLLMISIAVSFFIRASQYDDDITLIEEGEFDLAYGVSSIFKDKLQKFKGSYNLRVSLSIAMFILSVVPLLFVSMLSGGSDMILMMLILMILMIATGVYILIQVSAKHEAYNYLLSEGREVSKKSKRTKQAEKLAAFYWPLLTAIYIGWSLWTMNWGVTWIVWPVGAILFVALVGLMELLDKEEP